MKRVKNGSSLIAVLMTFSVLIIFGMAVLSLTVAAYQNQIVKSKEKRNMYYAESGLEIAYGKIGKLVDDGVKAGNDAVSIYMDTLDGEDGILKKEMERFKNGEDCEYPHHDNPKKSLYLNDDGSINEEYIKEQQNEKFKDGYKSHIMNFIRNNWIASGISIDDKDSDHKPSVKLLNNESEIAFNSDSKLNLKLESTFTEQSMEKIIDVNYNILVPDYNEPYYVKTNKIPIYSNAVWSKAICADGDMKVRGNFSVDGNVYVKGRNEGIEISRDSSQDSSEVNFTGNVVTSKDFRILGSQNVVNVKGNIYSGNVLVGDSEMTGTSHNISLNVNSNMKEKLKGAVYTNNDLALNSEKTAINIEGGFYGLNDVSSLGNIVDESKKNVSSSIYINAEDIGVDKGSSMSIGNKAILMGTAYIKTNPIYQTGESIAIKGNYKAYAFPLNSAKAERGNNKQSLKGDNVLFEYLNPLQLATGFKNGDSMIYKDKVDYFSIYAEEYGSESRLNLGNSVDLPRNENTIHIGAIVSNGSIASENYHGDYDGIIRRKQGRYAKAVYKMEDMGEDTDEDDNFKNENYDIGLKEAYDAGKFIRTVSSQIDFSKLQYNGKDASKDKDIIYLNGDASKDCVLIGSNPDRGKIPDDAEKINMGSMGRGIIITAGDIYICGKINFTGTIITNGDIIIVDDAPKNFKYDANYVKKLIAYNYKYFDGVFINNFADKQDVEVDPSVGHDDNVGTDIVRDKLIVTEKWKIIK